MSPAKVEPKRTPLHAQHLELGARMVEFAGWSMPVQYDGVLKEHERVRTAAGLFDVSHMGELFFTGPGALATLDRLATNDVRALGDGQALYTPLCNERGGVRDDVLVYRFDAARFMMVVNAANAAKILEWARAGLQGDTDLEDRSESVALLAVQGPRSADILSASRRLGGLAARVRDLLYYRFAPGDGRETVLVSRTGYTGELGYEIYLPAARAADLWRELLEIGRAHGAGPAGLAARDTLRFEVGYCLYGHELDEDTSPLEAGLGWTVKLGKPEFIGKAALERQKAEGPPRRLVGLAPEERVIARQGTEVRAGDRPVGKVTSGSYAPTLSRSLALALVRTEAVREPLSVHVRGRAVRAQRVDLPFHKAVAAA
jgi:glycine cleavage system T protein (aminomethyltransferase)